jgi:hypothetical protein
MPDPSRFGSPVQFRSLVRSMLVNPDGLFDLLFSAEHLGEIVAAEVGKTADRLFTPLVTLVTFLGQVLSDDQTCRAAVARLLAWRTNRGLTPCSTATGGYCRARRRLPESLLPRLVRESADHLRRDLPDAWLFHGRRVVIADGTTVSMPDTPENQAAYPQHKNQKPGCGFPLARVVVLLCLATGAAIDAAIGPSKGKKSGETTLLRGLQPRLSGGEILLGDRLFCTYFDIALLMARGVDVVFRSPTNRPIDFRRGERIGRDDHLIVWSRPVRPDWMDRATYATIPETLTIRQTRARVTRRGFRTRTVVVVTTLLDATTYRRDEIGGLYRMRWHAELDIRSIKQTMKMDVLRCHTPEMVVKEIWAHLLMYNLIRGVMAEAARRHEVSPPSLSLQGARQLLAGFRGARSEGESVGDETVVGVILKAIAGERVGDRPDRYEPRARKRRPKPYPLLQEPRVKARKRLERAA